MLGVASDGLVAPPGLLDRPSDLSQLSVKRGGGAQANPVLDLVRLAPRRVLLSRESGSHPEAADPRSEPAPATRVVECLERPAEKQARGLRSAGVETVRPGGLRAKSASVSLPDAPHP